MVESALRLPSIKSWNSRNMRRQLQRGPLATPCIEILTVTLLSNIQEIFIRAFSTTFFATSLGGNGITQPRPRWAIHGPQSKVLPWSSWKGRQSLAWWSRCTPQDFWINLLVCFVGLAWNSHDLTIYDHINDIHVYVFIYIYTYNTYTYIYVHIFLYV